MPMEKKKSKQVKMRSFKQTICMVILFCLQLNLIGQKNNLKKLIGKWNWVETSGGFAGSITNPSTEGMNMQMEFKKNGTVLNYKNNTLSSQAKYKLVLGQSNFTAEKSYLINYVDKKGLKMDIKNDFYEFKGNDTLVLREECFDCYTRIFVRLKK